ncbi:MAG: hypothetical protein FWC94_00965 [Bacteroidales bacterium]|nr:hypothetical protein [Bacteroidales bacterium]
MRQIVLSALIIFGSYSLFGQSVSDTAILQKGKEQAVFFSYSPTWALAFRFIDDIFATRPGHSVIFGEYGVKGVVYFPRTVGLFNLAYERSITNRLSWRVNLAYMQIRQKWDLYVDESSPHFFTERIHSFQLVPEIRFDYVKRRDVSLFMSGGLGLHYFHNSVGRFGDIIEPNSGFGLGFQIWLLGLEVAMIDSFVFRLNTLGFGTLGGVIEFGFGYRF